jgi:ammonium transporter, Amt family
MNTSHCLPWLRRLSFLLPLILLSSGSVLASESPAPAIDSGDNAWMLVCTALVLMMTAPGLILFYGGLVRRKNVLATMMHSLILMALASFLWMAVGYSIAFADGNAFFGNPLQYFFLNGVGVDPNPTYAGTIPQQTFMLFQMMFAIITPALISGAVAERIRFGPYLLFMTLWILLVYCPLAHMVWGNGGFFNWAMGGQIPVMDFAGGIVVHISSGVAALVAAVYLGKRNGYPSEPMIPHNVVLSLIGTGLLWVGWFGFNAGSALGSGALATSAFSATHFSAVGATLAWVTIEWRLAGRPSVLGAASGMIAGLATITPASGFVGIPAAFCIGVAGGTVCYFAVSKLKRALKYDDSLDVFGVHCMGSTVGILMLGFLADPIVNSAIASTFTSHGQTISLAGSAGQFLNQLKGVGFTIIFSGVATLVILWVVGLITPLRVTEENEDTGLDISEHGESAYND